MMVMCESVRPWNIEQKPAVLCSKEFLDPFQHATRHDIAKHDTYLERIVTVRVCHLWRGKSDGRHGAWNDVHDVVATSQGVCKVGRQRRTKTVTRHVQLIVLVHVLLIEVLDMTDNVVQLDGPLRSCSI